MARKLSAFNRFMSKCLRKHGMKHKSKSERRGTFRTCAKKWKS